MVSRCANLRIWGTHRASPAVVFRTDAKHACVPGGIHPAAGQEPAKHPGPIGAEVSTLGGVVGQPAAGRNRWPYEPRKPVSDTPFGFGLPPEEPENGDEGKKKDPTGGGQGSGGPANPFGFGPGAGGANPFAAMFGSMNPNDLGAAFQQLGQMLSYEGGPVNWDMAKQIARQTVAQGTPDGTKDASVGSSERASVDEA